MLPILIPLLGFAVQHAPGLLGLLAGEKAGEIAQGVVATIKEVLGTSDPVEAQAKIEANPALADELTARLNADVERYKAEVEMRRAELADVADARQMTVSLNQQGSPIAWTTLGLTVLFMIGYFLAFGALFFVRQDIPDKLFSLMTAIYGALTTIVVMIAQFWFGSSSSSQKKDTQIGNALQRAAMR